MVGASSFLPSVMVVCLVGLHILAVARGLYVSAPDVQVLHPAAGASIEGPLELSVLADDGPRGSGVRSVEFQLDSTSGAWRPLSLEPSSMTYKGSWDSKDLAEGEHALYIRATDYTGIKRTVFVPVKVAQAPARMNHPAPALVLSSWAGGSAAAELPERQLPGPRVE